MIPQARHPGPFRALLSAIGTLIIVAAGEAYTALRRWARP